MLNDKTLTFDKTLDKTLRASIFMLWLDRTVYALKQVREGDPIRILTDARRTLRPLSLFPIGETKDQYRKSCARLSFHTVSCTNCKKSLWQQRKVRAEWRIRDIFARSRHGRDRSQRRALWEAVERLCPQGYKFDFPWFENGDQRFALCGGSGGCLPFIEIERSSIYEAPTLGFGIPHRLARTVARREWLSVSGKRIGLLHRMGGH